MRANRIFAVSTAIFHPSPVFALGACSAHRAAKRMLVPSATPQTHRLFLDVSASPQGRMTPQSASSRTICALGSPLGRLENEGNSSRTPGKRSHVARTARE
jgi:hypothetical protein